MNLYAKRFGLGEPTGVEVYEHRHPRRARGTAGEGRALVSGGYHPGGHRPVGQSLYPFADRRLHGHCGQWGNRYKAHFVRKVTDYTRQQVIYENDPDNPTLIENVGVSEENMELVRQGMRSVVTSTSGTAYYPFANYGVSVAAKTGTAQERRLLTTPSSSPLPLMKNRRSPSPSCWNTAPPAPIPKTSPRTFWTPILRHRQGAHPRHQSRRHADGAPQQISLL